MEYITNIIFIIPCMQTTNKYGVFLVESSFIAFTFFCCCCWESLQLQHATLLVFLLFPTLSQTPLASPSVPPTTLTHLNTRLLLCCGVNTLPSLLFFFQPNNKAKLSSCGSCNKVFKQPLL